MKGFISMLTVVLVATIVDVAFLHYQANNGKLPFKFKIMPNIGI